MKKQIWLIAILVACTGISSRAQLNVSFNIGNQPIWGPVGYDYVNYYYIPDIDAYYDVPHQQYIYLENNNWVTRRGLPSRYRNYDMYNAYKVVINEPRPWMNHNRYRKQYISYRGRHGQPVIRDARDYRYYANPKHPHHNEWKGEGRGNSGHDDRGNRDHYRDNRGNGRDDHDRGHDNRGDDQGNDRDHGNGHGNGHGKGHDKH